MYFYIYLLHTVLSLNFLSEGETSPLAECQIVTTECRSPADSQKLTGLNITFKRHTTSYAVNSSFSPSNAILSDMFIRKYNLSADYMIDVDEVYDMYLRSQRNISNGTVTHLIWASETRLTLEQFTVPHMYGSLCSSEVKVDKVCHSAYICKDRFTIFSKINQHNADTVAYILNNSTYKTDSIKSLFTGYTCRPNQKYYLYKSIISEEGYTHICSNSSNKTLGILDSRIDPCIKNCSSSSVRIGNITYNLCHNKTQCYTVHCARDNSMISCQTYVVNCTKHTMKFNVNYNNLSDKVESKIESTNVLYCSSLDDAQEGNHSCASLDSVLSKYVVKSKQLSASSSTNQSNHLSNSSSRIPSIRTISARLIYENINFDSNTDTKDRVIELLVHEMDKFAPTRVAKQASTISSVVSILGVLATVFAACVGGGVALWRISHGQSTDSSSSKNSKDSKSKSKSISSHANKAFDEQSSNKNIDRKLSRIEEGPNHHIYKDYLKEARKIDQYKKGIKKKYDDKDTIEMNSAEYSRRHRNKDIKPNKSPFPPSPESPKKRLFFQKRKDKTERETEGRPHDSLPPAYLFNRTNTID